MPLSRASFAVVVPGLLLWAGSTAWIATQPVHAQASAPSEKAAPSVEKQPKTKTPLTLERPNGDPLLPSKTNGRALTPPEQNELRQGLEGLHREAEATYRQGDRSQAYRTFFRLLALSQYLPVQEELNNLAHVGRLAWRDNLPQETQVMTTRVKALETDLGEKLALSQRQALAEAYESLGAWNPAISQYKAVLAAQQPDGAKSKDRSGLGNPPSPSIIGQASSRDSQTTSLLGKSTLKETTLVNRLTQLSLLKLDYPAATLYIKQAIQLAAPRQDLTASPVDALSIEVTDGKAASSDESSSPEPSGLMLPLPSETAPTPTSNQLLGQLAYVYEQNQEFAEAAAVQQQLFPIYSAPPSRVNRQPALQVAIARNQARSGQLTEAISTYQAAYAQSQAQQQFGVSSNALSQLAALYRTAGQLDDALSVYDVLLDVHDLSYNLYGITDAQANRAEILVTQQQIDSARQAYRQAIHAAKLLGYREAEIQQRLDALK